MLVSERHLEVTVDARRKLVVATRGGAEVATAEEVTEMIAHARKTLETVQRAGLGILIDVRKAPLSVETRFAEQLLALRRELTREFRRAAFLVQTKLGLLQVQRFVREEKLSAQVFDDRERAIAYLTG